MKIVTRHIDCVNHAWFWIQTLENKLMNQIVSMLCIGNRKSETRPDLCGRIKNRKLVVALAVAFAVYGAVAYAQQPGKVFRIGFLDNSTASGSAVLVDAFRQELSKLGWIEG